MLCIVAGMGITRNEILAEYYLKAAGVAAIWIDPDGAVGAQDVARLDDLEEQGRLAFCCVRGVHFTLAYRLHAWAAQQGLPFPCQAALRAKLEELAEAGGVGITPHPIAIERALAAVSAVNRAMEAMKANGRLRDFNRDFKAARRVDASLRYHDYLHAHKAGMLEVLARETIR